MNEPSRKNLDTTQEFRDELLRHMARNDERWETTQDVLQDVQARLTSGASCVAGAVHGTKISALECETARLWKAHKDAGQPVRKAGVIGTLTAIGTGIAAGIANYLAAKFGVGGGSP